MACCGFEVGYGKDRERFGGVGRLRCKGSINSQIIGVITEINYSCIYIPLFFKYK